MTLRTPALGGHLPVLDGVRGVAIALVILLHLARSSAGEFGVVGPVNDVLAADRVGVDLFLVLSGFLVVVAILSVAWPEGNICPMVSQAWLWVCADQHRHLGERIRYLWRGRTLLVAGGRRALLLDVALDRPSIRLAAPDAYPTRRRRDRAGRESCHGND